MTLWRIAADTSVYTADDPSGEGAKLTGGRWNRHGTAVLYCASSIALACLETIVHLSVLNLPLNRYLVRFDVPDDVWHAARCLTRDTAPVGWDAIPYGLTSLTVGHGWLAQNESALLRVPSVVVPEESDVLINPAHRDACRVTVTKVRRWTYDFRASF